MVHTSTVAVAAVAISAASSLALPVAYVTSRSSFNVPAINSTPIPLTALSPNSERNFKDVINRIEHIIRPKIREDDELETRSFRGELNTINHILHHKTREDDELEARGFKDAFNVINHIIHHHKTREDDELVARGTADTVRNILGIPPPKGNSPSPSPFGSVPRRKARDYDELEARGLGNIIHGPPGLHIPPPVKFGSRVGRDVELSARGIFRGPPLHLSPPVKFGTKIASDDELSARGLNLGNSTHGHPGFHRPSPGKFGTKIARDDEVSARELEERTFGKVARKAPLGTMGLVENAIREEGELERRGGFWETGRKLVKDHIREVDEHAARELDEDINARDYIPGLGNVIHGPPGLLLPPPRLGFKSPRDDELSARELEERNVFKKIGHALYAREEDELAARELDEDIYAREYALDELD